MSRPQSTPLVLDPTGSDIQGESARIRARGPVTLVELPGGIQAWSVTDATTWSASISGDPVRLVE